MTLGLRQDKISRQWEHVEEEAAHFMAAREQNEEEQKSETDSGQGQDTFLTVIIHSFQLGLTSQASVTS